MYAELIRNRAFQEKQASPGGIAPWTPIGSASLAIKSTSQPLSSALPKSLIVLARNESGVIGFANPGWWGIHVGVQKYTGSFYVKGDYSGKFTASLQSKTSNEVYGKTEIESKAISKEWVQHEFTITPTKTAPNTDNIFSVTFHTKVRFRCPMFRR